MDPEKALRDMAAAIIRFIAENPNEGLSVSIQLGGVRFEIRYQGRDASTSQPVALRVGQFKRSARFRH